MATVDVSVSSDLPPERAWVLASDLRRFDEWLTIFGGWRGEVPSQIEVGTCASRSKISRRCASLSVNSVPNVPYRSSFWAADSYGQCNIRGFRGCDAEWISAFEGCALDVVRPGVSGNPVEAGRAGDGRVDDVRIDVVA